MTAAVPAILLIGTIVGAIDYLTNLTKIGDSGPRNAVIKVTLAFLGTIGILLWAAQTTIAGGFSLHGIVPSVASEATLKSLSVADVAFASLFIAMNASVLATFRKVFDNNQSAAQPSLTTQSDV